MKSRRPLPDPASIRIPAPSEDVQYREIAAGIVALEARLRGAEDRRNRARAMLRAERPEVVRSDVFRPVRGAIEAASALVAGGRVAAVDPSRELVAAEQEIMICKDALSIQEAHLRDRLGELSLALANKFKSMNRQALAAAVESMGELFSAFEIVREINARIQAAGYSPPSWILPMTAPEGALMLGDPAQMHSEASRFARFVRGLD